MTKKAFFCYTCEKEFTVNYKSKEDPEFCCFCATDLELADQDEREDEGSAEWEAD